MPVQVIIGDIGWFLLAGAMLWYGLLLRKLLRIIGKPPVWVLLVVAAVAVVVFIMGHLVAYSQYVPHLPAVAAYHGLWLCRFIAFAAVFVAGAALSVANWLYRHWTA